MDSKRSSVNSITKKLQTSSAERDWKENSEHEDMCISTLDKISSTLSEIRETQYCVFDLEMDVNDKKKIHQFAYLKKGKMIVRNTPTEDDIYELIMTLQDAKIIIGHNIQNWDSKKLLEVIKDIPNGENEKLSEIIKEIFQSEEKLIWDTLEMEMYLSPDRVSYSLVTTHDASEDVRKTENLFWNQICRLRSGISYQSFSYLDKRVDLRDDLLEILDNHSIPENDFFDELNVLTGKSDDYFHKRLDIGSTFFEMMKSSDDPKSNTKGNVLIVAPKNLWTYVSRNIRVCFPYTDDERYRMHIDSDLVSKDIDKNAFSNKNYNSFDEFLYLVFFAQIKNFTPLVSNLPKVYSFDYKEQIKGFQKYDDFSKITDQTIECTDLTGLTHENFDIKKYRHVYFIQRPLLQMENTSVPLFSIPCADFLQCRESQYQNFPFRVAPGQCLSMNLVQLERLACSFGTNLKYTISEEFRQNYWCERDKDNVFNFYYSLNIDAYVQSLKNCNIKVTDVNLFDDISFDSSIIPIRCDSAVIDQRILYSTETDGRYWYWQFSLLRKYMADQNISMPVVLISDNDENQVKTYAKKFNFEFRDGLATYREFEVCPENGMIFLSRNKFPREVDFHEVDKPFLYVWDHLDIEQYEKSLSSSSLTETVQQVSSSEQSDDVCLDIIYEGLREYEKLIRKANPESRLLILDPYLDFIETSQKESVIVKPDIHILQEKIHKELKNSGNKLVANFLPENAADVEEQKRCIRQLFIDGQQFRDIQEEVIQHILKKDGDCVVSIPTGGGKSILFQGPSLYRGVYWGKLSLVIMPLRALMQDQVTELHRKGFTNNVAFLNGDLTPAEKNSVYARLLSGELTLLYVTPERFRVKKFVDRLKQRMERDGGLEYVIFDEAHCISQWGLDFRPDYRYAVTKCIDIRENFAKIHKLSNVSSVFMVTMFSATVSAMVRNDLKSYFPNLKVYGHVLSNKDKVSFNPVRDHIRIRFQNVEADPEERLNGIIEYIEQSKPDFQKSRMIVFCPTRRLCEDLSMELEEKIPSEYKCKGKIGYFHAGLEPEERTYIYERFNSDGIYILFATKAFGMGMDIPNIHYLIHYEAPQYLEDYLQEVGRAGRDLIAYNNVFAKGNRTTPIDALCLTAPEDFENQKKKLLRGQLSWTDVRDTKEAISNYLKKFIPDSKIDANQEYVITPYSVWLKNPREPENDLPSKQAFYWLERMQCIKTSYSAYSYLKLELLNKEHENKPDSWIWDFISTLSADAQGQKILPIQQVLDKTWNGEKKSCENLVDELIRLMKGNFLTINQTFGCRLTDKRIAETLWMFEKDDEGQPHGRNNTALHIAFEAFKELLTEYQHKYKRDCQLDPSWYATHLKNQLKDLTENDNMPWREVKTISQSNTILKKSAFIKSLKGSLIQKVCTWPQYQIPGVAYRPSLFEGKVTSCIRIYNLNEASDYLVKLEQDCYDFLEIVSESAGVIDWPTVMSELNLDKYSYFKVLLAVLRDLQYIEFTPPIEYGIALKAGPYMDSPWSQFEEIQTEFDRETKLKRLRLIAMKIFSSVTQIDVQEKIIKDYFRCKDDTDLIRLLLKSTSDEDIKSELREDAINLMEQKLDRNPQQKEIYNRSSCHTMVLAGPGSGKTEILTMKCARLVYRENVQPESILVLAFNRSVVVELRRRLNDLFSRLGLGKTGDSLNIYTYDALILKCKPDLMETGIEDWSQKFADSLNEQVSLLYSQFPNIKYVLVDEFQDVNQDRLNLLLKFNELYNPKFFVIGDTDQSIYGFSRVNDDDKPELYAENLSSQKYYNEFQEKLDIKRDDILNLNINYRSYPDIIEKAGKYRILPIPNEEVYTYCTPEACDANKGHDEECAFFHESNEDHDWINRISELLNDTDEIKTIAVMFRSNDEVLHAYQLLKENKTIHDNAKLKLQQDNHIQVYRRREFYWIIQWFEDEKRMDSQVTRSLLDKFFEAYENEAEEHDGWSDEMVSLGCSWVRYSLENSKESKATCGDIAKSLRRVGRTSDDGFLYRIHEQYNLEEDSLPTITVTTMHRVKGLEFDAVIVGPSTWILPRKGNVYATGDILRVDDEANLQEEVRLQYVACTRARKRLDVYMGKRVHQIDSYLEQRKKDNQRIIINDIFPDEARKQSKEWKSIRIDSILKNYDLGYSANKESGEEEIFGLLHNVDRDTEVEIQSYYSKDPDSDTVVYRHYIMLDGVTIGRLSFEKWKNTDGLSGRRFKILDVAVWEQEDSIYTDKKKNTDYSSRWCSSAKERKYTYVPILKEIRSDS